MKTKLENIKNEIPDFSAVGKEEKSESEPSPSKLRSILGRTIRFK